MISDNSAFTSHVWIHAIHKIRENSFPTLPPSWSEVALEIWVPPFSFMEPGVSEKSPRDIPWFIGHSLCWYSNTKENGEVPLSFFGEHMGTYCFYSNDFKWRFAIEILIHTVWVEWVHQIFRGQMNSKKSERHLFPWMDSSQKEPTLSEEYWHDVAQNGLSSSPIPRMNPYPGFPPWF